MKLRHFFATFTLLLAAACGQDKPAAPASPAAPAAQPAAPPAAPDPAPALPSVSLEMVQKLWNECTHVDYIFYDLPMSMSLDDKVSIQHAVRHIAEGTAPLKPQCKPAGRVSYQVAGNIVLDGDFYFSSGCTYFVFSQKGQKTHANLMTDEGITYFNTQIQNGLRLRQQQQGN